MAIRQRGMIAPTVANMTRPYGQLHERQDELSRVVWRPRYDPTLFPSPKSVPSIASYIR